MTRPLGFFVVGTIAGLALLAALFSLRAGNYGVLCVAVAGAICGLPTLASMALTLWSRGRSASEQLMAVTGGMFIRMGAVLALSLPVFLLVPPFRETKERQMVYWSAILICYLGTLTWETVLTARHKTTTRGPIASPAAGEGK